MASDGAALLKGSNQACHFQAPPNSLVLLSNKNLHKSGGKSFESILTTQGFQFVHLPQVRRCTGDSLNKIYVYNFLILNKDGQAHCQN